MCIVINWYIKCGGKVWINIFFDCLLIKKFVEICMGLGKGLLEWWVVNVKLGWVLFEFSYFNEGVVWVVFI